MCKKSIRILLGVLLLALLTTLAVPVFAANRVTQLAVDVALRADGSALITQQFTADTHEGTEFYLDYLDSGYLTITDFAVWDDHGPYTVLPFDTWDIHADFDEKAGKCGMLAIDDGVELCWGITAYGPRTYTVQYVLHGLVGAYPDADGFNYRFVNKDLGFFPTDVTLAIYRENGVPITDAEADIWAFGYDGSIVFDDGVIYAWTDTPLDGSDNMTIMVGLEKGVLAPDRAGEGSFEDVKERAFDGSDYDDDGELRTALIIMGVVVAGSVGVGLLGTVGNSIYRKKRMKKADYFRMLPNDGNLNVSHVLGSRTKYAPENGLIGARILRLLSLGALEPVQTAVDDKEPPLRLVHEPDNGDEFDNILYAILESAAGDDHVLGPKELNQFCTRGKGGLALTRLMDGCKRDGLRALVRERCLRRPVLDSVFDLTDVGNTALDELIGHKKYLLDFSLLNERGIHETVIWRDYMVYAVLLGVADQVVKQLRDMYPEQLPEVDRYIRYVGYTNYYSTPLYNTYHAEVARQQAARSGGSGGGSSYSGGGGFSGGGGGGTR